MYFNGLIGEYLTCEFCVF